MRLSILAFMAFFCFQMQVLAGPVHPIVAQKLKALEACKGWKENNCPAKSYPNQGFIEVAQVTCKNSVRALKCDQVKANLDPEAQKKFKTCEMPQLCEELQQTVSVSDCIDGFIGFGKEATEKFFKFLSDVSQTAKCNGDRAKKIELFNEYNNTVPSSMQKETPSTDNIDKMSCQEISKLLMANHTNQLQNQMRKLAAFERANPRVKGHREQYPPDLQEILKWMDENGDKQKEALRALMGTPGAIMKLLNDSNIQFNCYTTANQTRILCEAGAAMIVSAFTGAAGPRALTLAAKLAEAAGTKVEVIAKALQAIEDTKSGRLKGLAEENKDLRKLSKDDKMKMLEDTGAGKYTPEERVAAARGAVGRNLSAKEEKAVMEAHNVGMDKGHGYYTYTKDELDKKREILRQAGFKPEEVENLMNRGITGQPTGRELLALQKDYEQARTNVMNPKYPPSAAQLRIYAEKARQLEKFDEAKGAYARAAETQYKEIKEKLAKRGQAPDYENKYKTSVDMLRDQVTSNDLRDLEANIAKGAGEQLSAPEMKRLEAVIEAKCERIRADIKKQGGFGTAEAARDAVTAEAQALKEEYSAAKDALTREAVRNRMRAMQAVEPDAVGTIFTHYLSGAI